MPKKRNNVNPLKGAHRANSVDPQVKQIMDMMLRGEWVPGKSNLELVEQYNVSEITVKHWSAQAGRFIRMCHGDKEEIRNRHLAGIEAVFQRSLNKRTTLRTKEGLVEVDDADLRVALSSIELSLRVNHLLNREEEQPKVEVALEELAEILRAQGYGIQAPAKKESKDGSSKIKGKTSKKGA